MHLRSQVSRAQLLTWVGEHTEEPNESLDEEMNNETGAQETNIENEEFDDFDNFAEGDNDDDFGGFDEGVAVLSHRDAADSEHKSQLVSRRLRETQLFRADQ